MAAVADADAQEAVVEAPRDLNVAFRVGASVLAGVHDESAQHDLRVVNDRGPQAGVDELGKHHQPRCVAVPGGSGSLTVVHGSVPRC